MERSADDLGIGELAERTGVPAATLRSWETRYGFPRPRRLAAGHRRYQRSDVALVEEVLRERSAGLSLPAAISQASAKALQADGSVFAVVRRRHPAVQPQILRKATLLALTRAIEDEYCARAEHALLFASFQQQRYYRQSEERWRDLARTANAVVIFADFAVPDVTGGLIRISPTAVSPLQREWVLVCEADDYPVCLAGWEFPGQSAAGDGERRFEVLWSVDSRVVRDAAIACARLAESSSPGLNLLDRLPTGPARPPSPDLQRAAGLLARMAGYLDHRPT